MDFEDAVLVFAGVSIEDEDTRFAYGERRLQTVGYLFGRMVMVVWTPRDDNTRHVISMRKCNEREQKVNRQRLEEG